MFRNKVLVRATAPSSSSAQPPPPPPFLLRQVSFPDAVPSLDLDILCCRLSRRHRLACLPQPPTDALVVYQRCQSRAAAGVTSEIAAAFPDAVVGEEEEVVCSGSLVAKAVECGLRSLMLEHGWRFVGESVYVESTFAMSEERTDLCALSVGDRIISSSLTPYGEEMAGKHLCREVRSGRNDDFEFVVSPDAFRFITHKISDIASSNMMETFQHSKEVILDGCNLQTACTVLPTLQEGHVIGFSKILPSGQCLDKFTELCSLKHGLETKISYHTAVRITYGASWEKQWLPSSSVLQGSGLQPALKSIRASKAMSSLRSFIELLKAWNFFGPNQLVIKEQLLFNCTASLPSWDKAISKLTTHTARTDNFEDVDLARTNLIAKDELLTLDFRTPKPAALCSSSAKLCNTRVHEIALPLDDDDTGNGTTSINYGCQSQPTTIASSYNSQVTLLKPSFNRSRRAEKNKTRYPSEHSDAICSNKSSEISLPKSSHGSSPKASHANAVNSSSTSLLQQAIQASESEYPKRKHAEFLVNSYQGERAKAQQKDCLKRNLDTRRKIEDIPDVLQERKAMPDVEKDVLSTKAIHRKSNSVVGKDERTTAKKSKIKPEVVKDKINKKVIDHQKDELIKTVTKMKAKPVIDKDELTSTTKTKTKPNVDIDELTAKVIDHHRRGELRLLTVADLKCFLGAKKAKVGGTKEVLIQRAVELLS